MSGRIAGIVFWLVAAVATSAQAQTVEYLHTDALGSVVAVTDANRNVIERREYEPYGSQLTPAVSNGPGYTGHVQDAATGLVYMQQRYYDAQIGRFLSGDPVTPDGNTGDHFNRYRYAANNPYKFTDPDGRCEARIGTRICDVYGKPQTTGTSGHDTASAKVGQQMIESGEYKSVHYNQKMSTISKDPRAGGQQPDVAGVKHNGQIDTVEIRSNSQTAQKLDAKGVEMQGKLQANMRGQHTTLTVDAALGGKWVPGGGTALGTASAGIGLVGALLAMKENPNMSTAEFLARAFGVYDIAVAGGELPPPPPVF
jgi:RHS repeat-associated protein